MHDEARLKEFIRGASKLPVLPKVTIRLLNALDSSDFSTKEIAEIIEAEPYLTARLLRLANSSFYGHSGLISRVQRAVVVLGSKTIRSLALTVWTHTLRSQGRNAEERKLMAPLLAHGLAAGVAARMLAERISHELGEDAFIAGLLHDIGRVALVAQMGREYETRILAPATREGVPLHEKEGEILGFDHRAIGSALMASWTLPPFLANVVEMHHDAGIVPGDQFFVAAVALADSFSTSLGFNVALAIPRPEPAELTAYFGLADKDAVAEFLYLCVSKVRTMTTVLEKTR
jgi:HD-like signal output (HDOD) protein